jgi:hypothetical protein
MKEAGVIDGYYAKLNQVMLGEDYVKVTFIRAKYGPLSYILFLENMFRRLE